ncbi:MAG: DUF1800 domain-containing protein [Bacteroidota bacterium]
MGNTTLANTLVNPTSLSPFTGEWTYELAAHLLRRTTFGPNKEEIAQSENRGLTWTINQLFKEIPLPEAPLNSNPEEPEIAVGEPWISLPYYEDINVKGTRRRSMKGWTMENIYKEGISAREKLVLFWHNHFAIDNISDAKFLYRYSNTLRTHAWGDFKQLVKDITIDPSMLRFLNGNSNTKNNPNENYARELLELFTIGKGPTVGEGDYTNYTEDDVLAMAKILTGWDDDGYFQVNPDRPMISYFRPDKHDESDKQLSHRFDNVVISNAGENEYKDLIDIIFSKEEVAKFISRKLYRWYVYYKITDEVESNVIEPMAQLIIDNDYTIKPALKALFSSEHFFEFLNIGPMIASPLDYVFKIFKNLKVQFSEEDLDIKYRIYERILNFGRDLEQEYYGSPDVAGWKAYYQEPLYYRSWINATTLGARFTMIAKLAGNGYSVSGNKLKVDPLYFLENHIEEPSDPNKLIDQLVKLLFPQRIIDSQIDALKEILIPGLPDYEWTVEYEDYRANPDDSKLKKAVENKLKQLFQAMLNMPEAYLI